jgi:hypothetical protein
MEQRFDLHDLVAQEWERGKSRAYGFAVGWSVFGALIGLASIYRLLIYGSNDLAEGLALLGAGIAIAIASWVFLARPTRVPSVLVVSDRAVAYQPARGGELIERPWTPPRFHFVLHDRQILHAKLGPRDRFAEFGFLPTPDGPRMPIPEAAFRAIMEEAKRHALLVTRTDLGGVGLIGIRPAR